MILSSFGTLNAVLTPTALARAVAAADAASRALDSAYDAIVGYSQYASTGAEIAQYEDLRELWTIAHTRLGQDDFASGAEAVATFDQIRLSAESLRDERVFGTDVARQVRAGETRLAPQRSALRWTVGLGLGAAAVLTFVYFAGKR